MNKMIKRSCLLCAAAMFFLLTACGKPQEKSLYAQGLELISLMEEMAESEAYTSAYSTSPEIADIVSVVKNGDFSQPKAVYKITVPPQTFSRLAEIEHLEPLSPALREYVLSKAPVVLVSQINSLGGTSSLIAANICMANKTFVSHELSEDSLIYLYIYENTVPAIVTFTAGEDSTVSAVASFIFYQGFSTDAPQQIQAFFKEISAQAEPIKIENP